MYCCAIDVWSLQLLCHYLRKKVRMKQRTKRRKEGRGNSGRSRCWDMNSEHINNAFDYLATAPFLICETLNFASLDDFPFGCPKPGNISAEVIRCLTVNIL